MTTHAERDTRGRRSALVRCLGSAALCLALSLSACRRALVDWQEDLRDNDPWRRRMAALALGQAEGENCEPAFRSLVIHLRDGDAEVIPAIEDGLRKLAHRRPDLPILAMKAFAVERLRYRSFLAQVLLELELEGVSANRAEVSAALDEYLAAELASNFDLRVKAALEMQKKRAAGGHSSG